MPGTTPTTAERLVAAFRNGLSTPDNRWVELRSLLITDLRMERDAVLEIGRTIAARIVSSIEAVTTASSLLPLVRTIPAGSVDAGRVARMSTLVRRLTLPTLPEVLDAAEKDVRRLAVDLLASGTAREDFERGLEAAVSVAASWRILEAAMAGAQGLLAAVESLPPVDVSYLGHKLAEWGLDAAWPSEPLYRREAIDAVLSALVYIRLRQRSIMPPLDMSHWIGSPRGQCDPASRQGANSGPFRVATGCREVEYAAEQGPVVVSADALPELVIPFPAAYVDDYCYFPLLGPGVHTCFLAAGQLPGSVVSVTTEYTYGGSRVHVDDLKDAINAAGVAGVTASVQVAQQHKYVRLDCTTPVTGPSGWLAFHTFSSPLLERFFPAVRFADNHLSAARLVEIFNPFAAGARFAAREKIVCAGSYARPNTPGYGGVALVKASGSCMRKGGMIIPTQGTQPVVAVGDECIILPGAGVFEVTEVHPGYFLVDGNAGSGAGSYAVSPPLVRSIQGTGWTIHLGGRWYRFEQADWKIDGNLGVRYVDLGTRGHWALGSDPVPFVLSQQSLSVASQDETVASRMTVSLAGDVLASEIGFPAPTACALAYEWGADVTAAGGFRSRVRPGDYLTDLTNFVDYVSEVHDGYVILASPLPVTATFLSPRFVNSARKSWDEMLASLVLPEFDVAAFERAIDLVRIHRDAEAMEHLVREGSRLATDLVSVGEAASTYANQSCQAPGMGTILRAIRRLGLSGFHRKIQVGDLQSLDDDTRQTTETGIAAADATLLANEFVVRLTPVERVVLGMQD